MSTTLAPSTTWQISQPTVAELREPLLALRRHEYRWAFGFFDGFCSLGHADHFALCRTAIETDIDLPQFRAIATLPNVFS